ncbi:MAG: trigger factor [Gammaproteobacteria bacterium]
MQVTVEESDKLERKLRIQVPAERVEKEIDARLQKVGRQVKIKGFRPGKVPAKVVRQRYGASVRREVVGEVMQSTFMQAVSEQKLNPAGGPQFEPGAIASGEDFEYTATFEIYPEITLAKVDGLPITRKTTDVQDGDIDEMITKLRQQRSTFVDVDRASQDEDRVVIDFAGRLGDDLFEGGSSTDYPLVLGAGALLKDLEEGLVGMSAGEEKTVDVAFPDDYHAEHLAGKTAQFDVTVKSVSEPSLPEVDEAFMAEFGIEDGGMDAFREAVKGNMDREASERIGNEVRQQIFDALVEHNPVDLPQVLVDREVESLQRESVSHMGGAPDAELPPREPFVPQAEKRVSLGLLIGEVISTKEITADKAAIDARIDVIASGQHDPAAAASQIRGDHDMMHRVEMMVLEEAAVTALIADADVTPEKIGFNALMNLED